MKRKWTVLLALAGFAGLAYAALRREGRKRAVSGWPVNLAHRGASARLPENTLASFRAGMEAGAGGLELDVRLTRDGHPVVIHDATVDRTTDGSGAVAEMTLEEVLALDAGYRDGVGKNLRVPTLREVLVEFPGVSLNIDIKDKNLPGAEVAVLEALREAGAAGRALVVSEHHAVVRRFRRAAGAEVATGASRFEIGVFYLLSLLRLEALARPAYAALQVPVRHGSVRVVTPRFVAAARSRGVRVDVWTINDPGEMRVLLDLGVDVVMTDRPEVLAEVLRERG